MLITIESIDCNAVKKLGYVPTPSYPAYFSAPSFKGYARFLPASDDIPWCVGKTFGVEISQERVSGLRRLTNTTGDIGVFPRPASDTWDVCGVVTLVDPPRNAFTVTSVYIKAGDALFLLQEPDLQGMEVAVGDHLAFVVHEVSLWDEAL